MTQQEIRQFAERVERLCDYLLDRVKEKDGSPDLNVIVDLKEDAANLQFDLDKVAIFDAFSGLHNYVHGLPPQEN
jgi:hypothetical protein